MYTGIAGLYNDEAVQSGAPFDCVSMSVQFSLTKTGAIEVPSNLNWNLWLYLF